MPDIRGLPLIGVEVKAAATVKASDFKGLRRLADVAGGDLKFGVVLYSGSAVLPFGERLYAMPVSAIWA